MPTATQCRYAWLGTLGYPAAMELQRRLVEQAHSGAAPNTLLLLEHPPTYTRGRLSRPEHLLAAPGQLDAAGIPVYDTDRGGQITYHGPGQLVGYPVVNLREWGGGPLRYVRELERVIIAALGEFGLAAHTEPGLTGVWCAGGKVAAIGVKISRGIAFHGFAVNLDPDLSYYRHIIPCGLSDRPVTSAAAELGRPVDGAAFRQRLACEFGAAMGWEMVEDDAANLLCVV